MYDSWTASKAVRSASLQKANYLVCYIKKHGKSVHSYKKKILQITTLQNSRMCPKTATRQKVIKFHYHAARQDRQ